MCKLIFISIFILSITSCKKPVNLKDVDINNQQLVINGINRVRSTSVFTFQYLYLSKSLSVFDTNYLGELMPITDARIEMHGSDNIIENYFYRQTYDEQAVYENQSIIEFGQTYYLTVRHDHFTTATAKATVPFPAKINSVNITPIQAPHIPFSINVNFDDVENEENYYLIRLSLLHRIDSGYYDSITNTYSTLTARGYFSGISSNSILIDKEYDAGHLVTDEFFANTNTDISFKTTLDSNQFNMINNSNSFLTVIIVSMSKDEYLFRKTLYLYEENQDNPFSEPTQVYSNVENGMGIFAFNSLVSYTIPLD